MFRKVLILPILALFTSLTLEAKAPQLTPAIVDSKSKEIMKAHASQKELTPTLVNRVFISYIETLDPTKTYFIKEDIAQWIEPSDALTNRVLNEMKNRDYSEFEKINSAMVKAIERRRLLETEIQSDELPKNVSVEEFKDLPWTTNKEELKERLKRIAGLQVETAAKLSEEFRDKSLQRIKKRQAKYEEDILNQDPTEQRNFTLTHVLKAIASSLDSHTTYFTPEEAKQFMINVQQRLFGIGAQLRDDLNGFTIVKIVEGGPASNGKKLKIKDRIIAVDGEPVVGMDIIDAVELIRGPENTPVILTVIRETEVEDKPPIEEKIDITITRGEVVLTETRYESTYEPFGDGVIAYLRLYSFYQDPESSSASDLQKALDQIKEEQNVRGVILDLRYNSGGMLSQAVNVAGLFITKGIVVSIKDDKGNVQHLRDLDGKTVWNGPLVVLINRASASASEIVAGTLQDYGRAIIVGDDHSYGKGSFQTFTLNNSPGTEVNPEGEYKVTRGRYYTVAGRTPQLTGVESDIIVPGPLSEIDIGEQYTKFPLENDQIKENFEDDLSDIPLLQRERVRRLYHFNLQPKLHLYDSYIAKLKSNSQYRIENNKNYQTFLKELGKKDIVEGQGEEQFGQNDLQLTEANNILKDLILLMQ